ncbi:MAG: hypothetical protein HFF01_00770 [Erysipelotrichaceae bacterium]|nr:hypothetical protein [Erysipelotrichaceae bacterium]
MKSWKQSDNNWKQITETGNKVKKSLETVETEMETISYSIVSSNYPLNKGCNVYRKHWKQLFYLNDENIYLGILPIYVYA